MIVGTFNCRASGSALALALLCVSGAARAQSAVPSAPPPSLWPAPQKPEGLRRFGASGTVAVDGDASLFVVGTWLTAPEAARKLDGGFAATAHYFVLDDLAVGLSLGASRAFDRVLRDREFPLEEESFALHATLRVARNIPLSDHVSVFPGVAVGAHTRRDKLERVRRTSSSGFDALSDERQTGLRVEATAPLLFHVVPNAYAGLAPGVVYATGRASGGGGLFTLQASALFGAWWGAEDSVGESASPSDAPRFGDKGHIAVSSSAGLALRRTRATTGAREAVDIRVAPSVDYFVWDGVAIGLAIGADYIHRDRPASNGVFSTQTTVFSVAPRIGFNVPLAWWASWYPRLAGSIGHATEIFDIAERASTKYVRWGAAVDAPFLFHVASHAFLGLGPGAEVATGETRDGQGRLGVTLRGSTFIGAWW
jgi:hypothetical protein